MDWLFELLSPLEAGVHFVPVADLVLVAGNPLRRLGDARAVRAVVARGRLLERDVLLGPTTSRS